MKKLAVRIATVLAATALAMPALACDGMKTTTATSASKKPAVASRANANQEKGAAKAKPASEAKPASAAN
jgi:hypothetical protein